MSDQFTIDFEADLERDRARLATLAGELALKAGKHGVTSSDLRISAENKGILTGEESEARMNLLNVRSIMRKAGLVMTKQWRQSDVAKAKGSPNRVYVLPEFAEVAA
jgi:hypothetical protein